MRFWKQQDNLKAFSSFHKQLGPQCRWHCGWSFKVAVLENRDCHIYTYTCIHTGTLVHVCASEKEKTRKQRAQPESFLYEHYAKQAEQLGAQQAGYSLRKKGAVQEGEKGNSRGQYSAKCFYINSYFFFTTMLWEKFYYSILQKTSGLQRLQLQKAVYLYPILHYDRLYRLTQHSQFTKPPPA